MARRRLAIVSVAALLIASCGTTRRLRRGAEIAALDGERARFHMNDGSVYDLDTWTHAGEFFRGRGRHYDAERRLLPGDDFELAAGDVAVVEHRERVARGTDVAVAAMTLTTGASLALTAVCAANPKSCFGSCPTFYVPGAEGWTIQAEGFSTAIARSLEADDLDDLPAAAPVDGAITMVMRDEAPETHVVRRVALRVVDGPPGSRVLRDFATERFLALGASSAPAGCDDPRACAALAAVDGDEHTPGSDGVDLAQRATLTLRYPAPGQGRVALALTARNSLMNTFVFYHLLALHGRAAPEFLAAIERGEPAARRALRAFDEALGGVDVEARQGDEAWRAVATLPYIGPIARATRAAEFTVEHPDRAVELRLTFARAHWRLDAATLGPVMATDLAATTAWPEVTAAEGVAPGGLAARLAGDGLPVVTQPGDAVTMRFRVGPAREGTAYFLATRGYYHEWLRAAWLRDEDLALARRYIDDPRRALRELAPEFHAVEGGMEALFEASRFRGRAP